MFAKTILLITGAKMNPCYKALQKNHQCQRIIIKAPRDFVNRLILHANDYQHFVKIGKRYNVKAKLG